MDTAIFQANKRKIKAHRRVSRGANSGDGESGFRGQTRLDSSSEEPSYIMVLPPNDYYLLLLLMVVVVMMIFIAVEQLLSA